MAIIHMLGVLHTTGILLLFFPSQDTHTSINLHLNFMDFFFFLEAWRFLLNFLFQSHDQSQSIKLKTKQKTQPEAEHP